MKQNRVRKVGAPPGGRVHWLLDRLNPEIFKAYRLQYKGQYHNYRLYRQRRWETLDEFIIVRTSKHCFRITYFNSVYMYFKAFSCYDSAEAADLIYKIYKTFENM